MVVAHAKWALQGNAVSGLNATYAGAAYQPLLDNYGNLWLSADGDPVQAQSLAYPQGLLSAGNPQCMLLGQVGSGTPFSLGSRGSHLVTETGGGDLMLALNDTESHNTYANGHTGWCELWIAVCHPTL